MQHHQKYFLVINDLEGIEEYWSTSVNTTGINL